MENNETSKSISADSESETEVIEVGKNPESVNSEKVQSETTAAQKKFSIRALWKKICNFLEVFGIPDMFLVRFIAVFFLISGVNVAIQKEDEIWAVSKWRDFVPEVNGLRTILLMAGVFILLTVLYKFTPPKYRIVDQSFAISAILYFDITLLWRSNDVYLSMGVMFISVAFIYYAIGKVRQKKLYNKIPWWVCGIVVLAAAVLVGIFIGVTTVCRHQNFGSCTHDFGLFVQMYYSLAKDGTAITTCERDEALSHFYIHASYIFYALVPIYKAFPKEETLLIAQAVLTMGGIIPMFLIAKRHNMKGIALIFMGFAYTFSIGLIAPCFYEFHENAFLPTLLMWLLWAVDNKKYIMFYIMSVLVCIVKEDAPLYVVCIGMYMFFDNKKQIGRMNGLIMALFAGAYMMFITNWLVKNGDGQMMTSTRFGLLMIDSEGGLKEVVKNTLADPAYFFSLFIHEDTLPFFLHIMMPLLFIPFFTKKIHRYLLMLPLVIMNLVIGAGYGYAASVGYQYIFGPVCLLLYMCIINIDDMGQTRKQEIPVLLGSAALIMTLGGISHNMSYYENHIKNEEYFTNLENMLDEIPQDASVACDTWLLPHIADRDEVYLLDDGDYNAETNEIRNPERYDFFVVPVGTDLTNNLLPLFEEMGITLYDEIPGRIQVYKSPLYDLYENAE
ncbi:MAG: DUF2079 domain-containing protein [Ruminococcus sp.]|nr:DUF2079 domain-containing protein [Ruminococcus sp.]